MGNTEAKIFDSKIEERLKNYTSVQELSEILKEYQGYTIRRCVDDIQEAEQIGVDLAEHKIKKIPYFCFFGTDEYVEALTVAFNENRPEDATYEFDYLEPLYYLNVLHPASWKRGLRYRMDSYGFECLTKKQKQIVDKFNSLLNEMATKHHLYLAWIEEDVMHGYSIEGKFINGGDVKRLLHIRSPWFNDYINEEVAEERKHVLKRCVYPNFSDDETVCKYVPLSCPKTKEPL